MVYLDHAATTPMRPEVVAVMAELMDAFPGNPSSSHEWGRTARAALEDARERAAEALKTVPRSIHFVRGGTESVNLAILGRVDWALAAGWSRPRLLRSSLEHAAVRESMGDAEARGCTVEVIEVSRSAELSLPDGMEGLLEGATLVSMQWVNQETGLLLPVEEVAQRCFLAGVPLHVDAVQAVGRIPIDLAATPVSALSLSGHKLGGPTSTGILVLAEGCQVHPRLFGGGQERGIRPGTEDVAGAVGLTTALELSIRQLEEEACRLEALRVRLEAGLQQALHGMRVHGAEGPRAPHILNIGVPGLPRDTLPAALDLAGVAASAGSACRSGGATVSPVLQALYGNDAGAVAPLRLSLGWSTSSEDVDTALGVISTVIDGLPVA